MDIDIHSQEFHDRLRKALEKTRAEEKVKEQEALKFLKSDAFYTISQKICKLSDQESYDIKTLYKQINESEKTVKMFFDCLFILKNERIIHCENYEGILNYTIFYRPIHKNSLLKGWIGDKETFNDTIQIQIDHDLDTNLKSLIVLKDQNTIKEMHRLVKKEYFSLFALIFKNDKRQFFIDGDMVEFENYSKDFLGNLLLDITASTSNPKSPFRKDN